MYREREAGTAPKQCNAAKCRCSAGESSAGATAPRPAAAASRFGAEVGNRRPRTGAGGALRRSASNRDRSERQAA